jgi:hypothetical protein
MSRKRLQPTRNLSPLHLCQLNPQRLSPLSRQFQLRLPLCSLSPYRFNRLRNLLPCRHRRPQRREQLARVLQNHLQPPRSLLQALLHNLNPQPLNRQLPPSGL